MVPCLIRFTWRIFLQSQYTTQKATMLSFMLQRLCMLWFSRVWKSCIYFKIFTFKNVALSPYLFGCNFLLSLAYGEETGFLVSVWSLFCGSCVLRLPFSHLHLSITGKYCSMSPSTGMTWRLTKHRFEYTKLLSPSKYF